MPLFLRKLLAPPAKRPSLGSGLSPLLVGVPLLAVLFWLFVWPDIAIGLYWSPTPCEVLDGRVAESSHSDGSTYRAEIQIRYQMQGETVELWSTRASGAYSSGKGGKAEDVERFPPGASYTCWVNPAKPREAVILRGVSSEIILLLLPLIFIAVGLRALYYSHTLRNKSDEELSLAAQGAPATYIPAAQSTPGRSLPFSVPYNTDISGGVILVVVAAVLSAFAAVFVFILATAKLGGVGLVVMVFFLLVVGALALLLWFDLASRLRVALRVPTASLEVSTSPVRPGAPFDLLIKQPKPLAFLSLAVDLICEEEATRGKDSDSSTTERREVYTQSIFPSQPLADAKGEVFTHQRRVELPPDVMHSLDAPNNKIIWKLVVSGNTLSGVKFRRETPLVVHPPKPERAAGYRDGRAS